MRNELVQRVERNTKGRDLIIGDIHGCFTKMASALRAVGFDPEEGDRLFSVGDLVDRGPESIAALQFLAEDFVYAVKGNHEDYAARWPAGNVDPENYRARGGAWMMALDEDMQSEVSSAFARLPLAIELETDAGLVGIVHAEVPFLDWNEFTAALEAPDMGRTERKLMISMVMRSRQRIDESNTTRIAGVRAVVVGHATVPQMLALGNTLYIDTGGWNGGQFTILDAATLRPATRARRG